MKLITEIVKLVVMFALACAVLIGSGYAFRSREQSVLRQGIEIGRHQLHQEYINELLQKNGAPLLLYPEEPKEYE